MAQGVSDKAQRGYEHRISSHISKFCDAMFGSSRLEVENPQQTWSDPMDMSYWCMLARIVPITTQENWH